ncbi:MAG TPA: hypothetical protein VFX76_15080, partial [Roseiflexaceae bacterium]|nr:hypothetical protein [Roseiflexaceae bacterium]
MHTRQPWVDHNLCGRTQQRGAIGQRYLDAEGQPIAELPAYPFDQKLDVTIDGQTVSRKLTPLDSKRDAWAADASLKPGPRGGS